MTDPTPEYEPMATPMHRLTWHVANLNAQELTRRHNEQIAALACSHPRGCCRKHIEEAERRGRAEAWDEGYLRGTLDNESDLEPADNPYRETSR